MENEKNDSKHGRILWARRLMLWFALVGLFAASYLLYTYLTGTELRCVALTGCEIVRFSKWASWFGIPTPAFGVAFYLAVVALSGYRAYAPHQNAKWARRLIVLMACAGFAESVFLTLIQRFALNAFCFWCLVSAAAATGIFIFVWMDKGIEFGKEISAKELKVIFASLLLALVGGVIGMYLLLQPQAPKPLDLNFGQDTPDKIFVPDATTSTSAQDGFSVVATTTAVEGPMTAKVTITEFFDFQCPACGVYHKTVIKPLREKYQGRIRFAARHFPLVQSHPYAMGAAIAGVCAQRQDKFFEYYDLLYANQKALSRPDLEKSAQALGMDAEKFKACLDDPTAKAQVLADYNAGRSYGISGTPTIIINNALVDGTPNLDAMSKLIEERL